MPTNFTYIFRLSICLVGALFIVRSHGHAVPPESSLQFGLWIEAEGQNKPFESLENFRSYLEYLDLDQFTDLYCQVYRGGRSWFPSMVADDKPYRDAYKQGFDPLRETIDKAHAKGQKVHAWLNMLRVAHNTKAPILQVIGRKAVHTVSV